MTQIEGDADGNVRDAVAEALDGGELLLIGSREVNRAVDKLGDVAELTEKDFKKLATELEADAVVAGKLGKVGTTRTLKFRLFVHKKMAQGFTMSFKDPKSEKFRALLHDKMLTKIGAAPGDDEAEDKAARKKTGEKATEDEEEAAAAKKPKKAKTGKLEDEEEAVAAKKPKKAKAGKLEDEEEAKPTKKAKAGKLEDEEEAKPGKKTKADLALAEDEEAKPTKKAKAADLALAEDEAEARPGKKAKPEDGERTAGEDDETAAAGKEAADEEGGPRKAKKKVAAADGDGAVEAAATPPAASPRMANRPAAWVALGPSVLQRSLKYNAAASANQPRNVTLSPAIGGRIDGEIYPLALSSPRGALAGVGIGLEYEKVLDVNAPVAGMPNVTVPVKQSHFSVGLRYRLAFGDKPTSPTLTLGGGYGKRMFSVDRSKLTDATAIQSVQRDTPSSEYTLFDPGLMVRIPVTRMVAFSLGGRGMIITNAGPIQRADSYGRALVYGAEGTAVLDVVLGQWIALRFAGDFVQVGFTFKGKGALANGVGGLADRSIGGSAAIAVTY